MLNKMLGFIGATAGGAVGWWAGERIGFMTAFMLSMLGTGIGVYAGMRVARHYDI